MAHFVHLGCPVRQKAKGMRDVFDFLCISVCFMSNKHMLSNKFKTD